MRQTPYDSYLREPSRGDIFDREMRDCELEQVVFATYRMIEMYYYDMMDMWGNPGDMMGAKVKITIERVKE